LDGRKKKPLSRTSNLVVDFTDYVFINEVIALSTRPCSYKAKLLVDREKYLNTFLKNARLKE